MREWRLQDAWWSGVFSIEYLNAEVRRRQQRRELQQCRHTVAHGKDDGERVDDEVGNDEGDGMSGRRNIRREEEA